MIKFLIDLLIIPPSRYPDKWKPAFLAMQLGFIAGGIGLIGRDLLLILTIENWQPIIFSELFFASFVGVGFILHTIGFAKFGVILSCIAGRLVSFGSPSSVPTRLTPRGEVFLAD